MSAEDVDGAVLVASLNLVDLAGSENVRHTGAVSSFEITFLEAEFKICCGDFSGGHATEGGWKHQQKSPDIVSRNCQFGGQEEGLRCIYQLPRQQADAHSAAIPCWYV